MWLLIALPAILRAWSATGHRPIPDRFEEPRYGSTPFRGPYAIFTLAELHRIHALCLLAQPVGGPGSDLDESIMEKAQAAMGSDPKFREPSP